MKKIISFSLWGNNPTYNIGAIRNAEIAKDVYQILNVGFIFIVKQFHLKQYNNCKNLIM